MRPPEHPKRAVAPGVKFTVGFPFHMTLPETIEVIQILDGADEARGSIEAMAQAWPRSGLSRAVVVTLPPSPALSGLLRRIEGAVQVVTAEPGARFLDRLRIGLARTTGATVAVVADDVEVGAGWWRPLAAAVGAGASIAVARLDPKGPGGFEPCWQDIGIRACLSAPDHAAGLLLVARREALEALVAGGAPLAPACGSLAGLAAVSGAMTGGLVPVRDVPAAWVRRPYWEQDPTPVPELPPGVRYGGFAEGAVRWGPHTYFGSCLFQTWMPGERIVLGDWCSVASGVFISTGGGHRTDLASTFPFDTLHPRGDRARSRVYRTTQDTVIGNDVWIGNQVAVGGGARVGDGAVIATGSVVFGEVPAYAVVAGNPAKVLRYRFGKATIERLQRIAWWGWPEEVVADRLDWFHRPIAEFCDAFDPAGNGPAERPGDGGGPV
jgi:acetyltransferase-like isoleucine patch superfamily enzyme